MRVLPAQSVRLTAPNATLAEVAAVGRRGVYVVAEPDAGIQLLERYPTAPVAPGRDCLLRKVP